MIDFNCKQIEDFNKEIYTQIASMEYLNYSEV